MEQREVQLDLKAENVSLDSYTFSRGLAARRVLPSRDCDLACDVSATVRAMCPGSSRLPSSSPDPTDYPLQHHANSIPAPPSPEAIAILVSRAAPSESRADPALSQAASPCPTSCAAPCDTSAAPPPSSNRTPPALRTLSPLPPNPNPRPRSSTPTPALPPPPPVPKSLRDNPRRDRKSVV